MADGHDIAAGIGEEAAGWCRGFSNDADRLYHALEWGVPVRDDDAMFEHLSLECLQCGLSWHYVLVRRELFRSCFAGFSIDAVAAMCEADVERMLELPGMLRNRPKLRAIISNARAAQGLRRDFGGLSSYFWSWTEGRTILYEGHGTGDFPASNALSARIAADLKRRGFKYVGPTNIYAHLQACGIVCDHVEDCPCYERIVSANPCVLLPREGER